MKKISKEINNKAKYFLTRVRCKEIVNKTFYDTITFRVNNPSRLMSLLKQHNILLNKCYHVAGVVNATTGNLSGMSIYVDGHKMPLARTRLDGDVDVGSVQFYLEF